MTTEPNNGVSEKDMIVSYLLENQSYPDLCRASKIVCKDFVKQTKSIIKKQKVVKQDVLVNILLERNSLWINIANSYNNQKGGVIELCPDWFSTKNINGIVLSEL